MDVEMSSAPPEGAQSAEVKLPQKKRPKRRSMLPLLYKGTATLSDNGNANVGDKNDGTGGSQVIGQDSNEYSAEKGSNGDSRQNLTRKRKEMRKAVEATEALQGLTVGGPRISEEVRARKRAERPERRKWLREMKRSKVEKPPIKERGWTVAGEKRGTKRRNGTHRAKIAFEATKVAESEMTADVSPGEGAAESTLQRDVDAKAGGHESEVIEHNEKPRRRSEKKRVRRTKTKKNADSNVAVEALEKGAGQGDTSQGDVIMKDGSTDLPKGKKKETAAERRARKMARRAASAVSARAGDDINAKNDAHTGAQARKQKWFEARRMRKEAYRTAREMSQKAGKCEAGDSDDTLRQSLQWQATDVEQAKEQQTPSNAPISSTGGNDSVRRLPNIAISGTPGTGKTTFARTLARALRMRKFSYGILDFAGCDEAQQYRESYDEERQSWVMNEEGLATHLTPSLMRKGGAIIDWIHAEQFEAAPKGPIDLVITMKASDTKILYDCLKARQYNEAKITENMDAEIMRTIWEENREAFGGEDSIVSHIDQTSDGRSFGRSWKVLRSWVRQWVEINGHGDPQKPFVKVPLDEMKATGSSAAKTEDLDDPTEPGCVALPTPNPVDADHPMEG